MARWTRERPVFQFRRSQAPQDPGFESPKFPNMDPNAGGAPFRPQGKVHQMSSNLASGHLMRWVNTPRSRFLKIFHFGPVGPRGRERDLGRWEGGIKGCGRTPSRATHEVVDGALDSRETRLPVPQVTSAPRSRVRPAEIREICHKRMWAAISTQSQRSPFELKFGIPTPHAMGKHIPKSVLENLSFWVGGT